MKPKINNSMNLIITNNNPKDIIVKSIYDEKKNVMRINIKLKRQSH